MNLNGKQFFLSALTLFCAVTASATPSAGIACNEYKRAITKDSWKTIPTDAGVNLYEGTYRGTGKATRHVYYLHLLQYLNYQDAFLAVSEDEDAKTAKLGFLVKSEQGVYDWYGIKIKKDGDAEELDIPMEDSPMARFYLELDSSSHVSQLVARNLNPSFTLESVEYTDARATLFDNKLSPGVWKRKKNSLTLIPGSKADENPCSASPSRFAAHLRKHSEGSEVSSSYTTRQELPGIFSLRPTGIDGYRPTVSTKIAAVAVSIRGYSGFLFFGGRNPQVYIFDASGEFLSAKPEQLTLEN